MKKRIIIVLFTLIGAILGLGLSVIIENCFSQETNTLPTFVEVGIFFTLPSAFAATGGLISALICPIVPLSRDVIFRNCVITVIILSVTGAFLLSAGAQKLYEISLKNSGNSVIIALDQSASMQGERNSNTIQAAQKLVDSLGKNDRVGLVFFGDEAIVKSEIKQANNENKEQIKQEIRKLEATDGTNILQYALDESVRMLSRETSKNKGIFFVSDLDGANDLSLMGNLDKNSFIAEEIPLHTLVINATENYEMQEFCKKTGGKCIHTDNPDDIEELYMTMFYEFYEENLQLNHIRNTKGIDWLRILISSIYFIILGVLMSAVYTIMYNNRHILFVWNFIIGIVAAIAIEINNFYFKESIIMVIAILVIYPTTYIGSLPEDDRAKINKQLSGKHPNGVSIFDEGHIIK